MDRDARHSIRDIAMAAAVRMLFPPLILLLSSCAFSDVQVKLPEGIETGLSGGKGRRIAVVTPFRDDRQIANRIGMNKNGMNWDTADVVCPQDPATWVGEASVAALQAAGFSVVTDPNPGREVLRLEGRLLKLFTEPVVDREGGPPGLLVPVDVPRMETDFHVELVATAPSGVKSRRSIFVKGYFRGLASSTSEGYEQSLDDAMKQMMRDLVGAVLTLVNRPR